MPVETREDRAGFRGPGTEICVTPDVEALSPGKTPPTESGLLGEPGSTGSSPMSNSMRLKKGWD